MIGIGRPPRAGLALLGALYLAGALPALLAPRRFFETFPGLGHRWTAAYPPYNQHLVTDLGAAFATLATLLLLAAWLGDRRVALVVLAGVLVYSSLHLAFHATHHGTLSGVDLAASLIALVLGVLIPVVLLLAIALTHRA
jgi:hypothetical protein